MFSTLYSPSSCAQISENTTTPTKGSKIEAELDYNSIKHAEVWQPFDQNTIDRTVAFGNPSPPRHQGVAGAREHMAALVISKKIQETEPALQDLQELVTFTKVLPPDHYQMSSQFRKQDLGRRGEFGTIKPLTLSLHHSRGERAIRRGDTDFKITLQ